MNLLEKLQTEQHFSYNEQLIVEFILKDPEAVLHLSIYDLATQTNSSTSTIIRLCKKCRVSGFKEFKIILAHDLATSLRTISEVDANLPFTAKDTDRMISQKIARLTTETIEATQAMLTTQKLNHCVQKIIEAKNIYAIGVSDSYIRLLDFQTKLLRINMFVRMINLQAEQYHLALSSQADDVAIMVSYSGRTAEIVNDAKTFYQNKTPIIAITSDEHSPLATYASEVLLLPNKESAKFKVSNFSSHLAIEYMLNVLYSCIFNRNFERNYEEQQVTPISKFEF